MNFFLLLSLLMVDPQPQDMPRAESYLVQTSQGFRLEDRYSPVDLWLSRTLLGEWTDADGRYFAVAQLGTKFPELDHLVTRTDFAAAMRPIERRDELARHAAIVELSPIPLAEKGLRPRQKCRGYRDITYWHGTNTSTIVCEFRPEKSDLSYLGVWILAPEDDQAEKIQIFEDEFLVKEFKTLDTFPGCAEYRQLSETEALRLDAHNSVTNLVNWHWTDVQDYTVIDDLRGSRELVTAITNLLPKLKADFVKALPTSLDGTNVLGVVRIFANREEYLGAVDEDMSWTAAYWSPLRREIVAHLPRDGYASLLRTFRHEAFHQYLSYATAMIPTSPWLNEGYAQYFEDPKDLQVNWTKAQLEPLASLLKLVFDMNYAEFYAGSDQERRLKYKLAWSVAVFIEHEKGARKVRHDPFEHLKSNYLKTLVNTQDMLKATEAAFGNADYRELFVSEWKRFWKTMLVD